MPPTLGSIHRVARSDSGAARLWAWARRQKKPWSADDAAEACDISRRRCRAIVAALRDVGLLVQVDKQTSNGHRPGCVPATYRLSDVAGQVKAPPIMVVDRERGVITGVRLGAP